MRLRMNDPTLTHAHLLGEDILHVNGNTHLQEVRVLSMLHVEALLLAEIPSLKKITLTSAGLSHIEELSNAKIEELVLDSNRIISLEPLRCNDHVKRLRIASNRIENLNIFTTNTTLEELYADHNPIESLEPLQRNTTLKRLYVGKTRIQGVEPLANNTALEHLRIADTRVDCIDALSGCTSMQSLGLDHTLITNLSSLQNMINLAHLSISGTEINDIHPLRQCKRLETIQMNDTKVSDMSPLSGLVCLRSIYARNNGCVTDISFLKELVNLAYVDMSRCDITHLPDLGMCTHLDEIILSYNCIETADVWSVCNTHNRLRIDLDDNFLTNLNFLRGNSSIRSLGVRNNKIIDIDAVETMHSIGYLDVSNNEICSIPKSLPKSLRSLCIDRNRISNFEPLASNTRISLLAYSPQKNGVGITFLDKIIENNRVNLINRYAHLRHIAFAHLKNPQ